MDISSTSPNSNLPIRLRLKQAAEYLAVSPRSLADRGWRFKHGIPALKIGRAVVFDRLALDRWLARHQERPLRALEDPTGENGGRR